MSDKYFQSNPDSYAKFKWNNQQMEGEFFQSSLSLIDDSQTTEGYIRPFDRDLRQAIIDAHMKAHKHDYEDFFTVGDLVECDSLVTHNNLKRPYLDVVVEDFEFIDEKDLTTNNELISDCRADLLRRQYILAKALNESEETLDKLLIEYRKFSTPITAPLRYKRTKFEKLKQNSFLHFAGIIILLLFLIKLDW